MEKTTFLGKPGYMRIGTGVIKISGQRVKFIQKVCDYNGLFTVGTIQESFNNSGQIPKEVEELFKAVEASLRYSDSQ